MGTRCDASFCVVVYYFPLHHHHHPNPLVVMEDAVAMFSPFPICCRNLLYFLSRLNATSSTAQSIHRSLLYLYAFA